MKKIFALILSLVLALALVGCAGEPAAENTAGADATQAPAESAGTESPAGEESAAPAEGEAYKVAIVLGVGGLGDESFNDSMYDGCQLAMAEDPSITVQVIEPTEVAEFEGHYMELARTGEYDLIICGTYQMPDYLNEVAANYPDQKYLIYDSESNQPNVANINYKQNDMGYLVGTFAAAMTTQTDVANINADKVIGFVGGVDSPVINDFLYGFITGAQAVDPEIKIDTAKELALSMINDNNVDIVWGVAGLSGNGAAEAALESGKAYFIGVDSDQELTLSTELAAITLTSGLKNIGQSLIWFFDEWDAGTTYWGQSVLLGLNEGGVGIVTDKNYATIAPQAVQDTTNAAIEAVANGEVTVPTAIGDETGALEELRESVRP